MIIKKSLIIGVLMLLVLSGCSKRDSPVLIDTTQGSAIGEEGFSESSPLQGGFIE